MAEGGRWGPYWVIGTGVVGTLAVTKISMTEKGPVILSMSRIRPPGSGGGEGGPGSSSGPTLPSESGNSTDVSEMLIHAAPYIALAAIAAAVLVWANSGSRSAHA